MDEKASLNEFAQNFRELVRVSCESGSGDEERFQENMFTDEFLKTLEEGNEIVDWQLCPYTNGTGSIKVNAINLPEGDDCIDMFLTVFTNSIPPEALGKDAVDVAFKKVVRFFSRSIEGFYKELEETSPAYPLARQIFDARKSLHRVRFFLLTDARVTRGVKDSETVSGMKYSYQIWDIARLQRLAGEKAGREVITIDFKSKFGETIPCLMMPMSAEFDHETCVAIFPGKILSAMYEDYGPKLLQRNVRSFLQARGNVNSGIRDTILKEPDRFLAYNNGITATASEVEFVQSATGWAITSVSDFQIVNGGQTTAGIYYAHRRKDADLSKVFVQAKISRIRSVELINKIVPLISKYANSQNKISESDFASNDPFHTCIHDLSQKVWAPPSQSSKAITHWYYERARGQYAEEKAQRGAKFSRDNPVGQLFDKTELAKVSSCWDCEPYLASLGPQKNFLLFSKKLAEQNMQAEKSQTVISYDQDYFKKVVAKLIIFKACKDHVDSLKQKYQANRMNIVYYTISYMVYQHLCEDSDLLEVWRNQVVTPKLMNLLPNICETIYFRIKNAAGEKIVGEWCKREACWADVRTLQIT